MSFSHAGRTIHKVAEDVEKLTSDIRDVNEKANYIIRGGTDKAADLAAHIAAPTGTIKED